MGEYRTTADGRYAGPEEPAHAMTAGSRLTPTHLRVLGALPVAVRLADANGRYVYANPAAEALLGYSQPELLHLRVPDLVVASREWTGATYARLKADGHWRGRLTLRHKAGHAVEVETHTSRFADGLYLSMLRPVGAASPAAGRLLEAIGQVVAEAAPPDALLRNLAESVRRVLGLDLVALLMREDAEHLRIRVAVGMEVATGLLLGARWTFSGRVLASGEPLVVTDITSVPDVPTPILRAHARSIACVPVQQAGQTMAVLLVGSATARSFTPEDMALLQLAAERASTFVGRRRDPAGERRASPAGTGQDATSEPIESGWARLTQRQQDVARLIVEGRTNAQIGQELGLAPGSVANYVAAILDRLKLTNRAQLAAWASQQRPERLASVSGLPGARPQVRVVELAAEHLSALASVLDELETQLLDVPRPSSEMADALQAAHRSLNTAQDLLQKLTESVDPAN